VLGLSRSRVDFDEPLNRLGLDSLMAVELKNRIDSDLGVNVPLINFARNPSVAQLTANVLDQFRIAACVSGVAGSRVHQPPVEAIANSDWEVVKL
jgi:phthiocerol/phenolphthiocerol synthesis type-I polyketide synthase D